MTKEMCWHWINLAVKQPVPSPEEQEAQRAQMAAQEAQREEMRLDESTDLAFDLDVFLRQYSDAYADMHPVFHEEKERMADELLSGQTGKIRMRMATVIRHWKTKSTYPVVKCWCIRTTCRSLTATSKR